MLLADFTKLPELINRDPDFIIGPHDDPYMRRWWLIPRNKEFNIYLHEFLHDDDDRALHDHPWDSLSIVLSGKGREIEPAGFSRVFAAGEKIYRTAWHAHRIELVEGPLWTLFFTGPTIREWGFHCPNGWRHWKEFCDDRDSGQIGKGCD